MGVKRYWAKSDNTITNAFEENLTTRGTGSNMGASDILEVFSIYGQANSSSAEKSRSLIKFNVTASTNSIKYDRDNSLIGASGSVSFYLRLFNAPHSQTLPKNYTIDVSAVSGSWLEGTGLDMELYKDKGSSNWVNAVSGSTAATATIQFNSATAADYDDETFTVTSTDGTTVVYTLNDDSTSNTYGDSTTSIGIQGAPAASKVSELVTAAGNNSSNAHADKITFVEGASATVTLTQDVLGRAGNNTVATSDSTDITVSGFTGGDGAWANEGGDYYTDTSSSFSASFDTGTEDIELDITTLVEQWISSSANSNTATDMGLKNDDGVIVRMPTATEAATRSYYTKKFFGRETEFFFKRPCIEARWNDSTKDERGTFYYSSSLATAAENLNTLYFYNYFRGQLRNIPGVGAGNIYVSFFSGSKKDTAPSGSALQLVADGTHVRSAMNTVATGGYVSKGIYSASVALTAAATPVSTVYDVWFSGGAPTKPALGTTQYHTGTIKPESLYGSSIAPANEYVSNITNLKTIYRGNETARFRIYTRQKDWSPTIYTKATAKAEVNIVESGSYEIYRVADDLKVVPYGTGSSLLHTQMSFDSSGSYFDLDMGMLEPGYMYGIKFAYYNNSVNDWVEQPETFKFRVESRQS